MINERGGKYAVITTTHHDGVVLWPTKQKHYNYSRIPLQERPAWAFLFCIRQLRNKTGAYFSLLDCSYPDYPGFQKDSNPKDENDSGIFFHSQIKALSAAYKPHSSAAEWQAAKVKKEIISGNPTAHVNGQLKG